MEIWTISSMLQKKAEMLTVLSVGFLVCSIGSPEPPSRQKVSRISLFVIVWEAKVLYNLYNRMDMQETQEELAQKVRDLQKEVEQLRAKLKENRSLLTWMNVPEAFEKESDNKIPVIEEVRELTIHNDDGKPTHILIEGDNYHALTCLNYTHRGNIDVIYIDPPYNTGKKDDFIYNDARFLEEYPDGTPIPKNHPQRHSTWLSFMYKRLSLSYELLSDNGTIFISIDDNEQAVLKLLCDKIFGIENFVANIIWQKKFSPQNDAKWFSDNHDFIICYAKNKQRWRPNLLKRSTAANLRYKNPDNDPRGDWASTDLAVKTYSEEYDYPITTPSGKVVMPTNGRCWMTSKERMAELIADNRIWFGKKGNNMPRYKTFLSEVQQGIVPLTIWLNNEVGHNQSAKQELKKIFHDTHIPFGTPKPTQLIHRILEVASNPSSIILDFFAGSGTTLHAVMQLNNEDEGKRQCILCQINESNICRDVTYERNRRVMQGYQDSKGKEVVGLGNSLKYYRTAFVGKNQPKAATDDDKLNLSKKAGCLLGLAENTLYESLTTDYYQFYTDENGRWTCIYFQEDYSHFEVFRQKVVEIDGKEKCVYVFSWTDGAEFATEFEFEKNVTVKSIPQPILDIYKSLNA